MRKVIYWVHTSVDGFIDGPNGEFDWTQLGPELAAYSEGLDREVDTLLFGRPVWEMMVGYWPTADENADDDHAQKFAPFWRSTPKVVASRSYAGDEWTSRVIGRNLADEMAALKAEDGGDILLTGGSALATALTEHRLIDEYHVAVHPVALGGGRRLLGGTGTRVQLRPRSSRLLDGRVTVTAYTVD